MKARACLALVLLALPGWAHSQRYSYIPVYIPGEADRWTVKRGIPYAVWNATTTTAAGSGVTIAKANDVVESAPLGPQSVYAVDQDLTEDQKVWLPQGGLLIKMAGGDGDWYCTWRFDTRSSSSDPKPLIKKDAETELCLRSNANGTTYSTRLAQAMYASLMTITFFGTRVGQNEIEQTNSVGLKEVDPASMPARASLEVIAERKKDGVVCLKLKVLELKSQGTCFGSVGETVQFAGGSYTLTSPSSDSGYTIRVDSPMSVRGLAPDIVK